MPARIKLIVTGDMERQALKESLQRAFPFSVNGDGDDVLWDEPRKTHCVTSTPLPEDPKSTTSPMQSLAKAMLSEALTGKRKNHEPASLVIAVDDAELANLGRESLVASHLRHAIDQELADSSPTLSVRERNAEVVKARCSFHLLRPMVEAYLFGDPLALEAAGVRSGSAPQLLHPSDVEAFEVADPAWLPECRVHNGARLAHSPWWRHERHPKHYLEHLVQKSGAWYDETSQGARALRGLLWGGVPKFEPDVAFLRALFQDIADWFAVPNPLGKGPPAADFYPAFGVNRAGLKLRNL